MTRGASSTAGRSLALAALMLLGGCSLTALDVGKCSEDADCREAFGLGHVCDDDGFCEEAQPHPRCARAYPEDLLTDPEAHRDTIVLGSLQDLALETKQARERATRLAVIEANAEGGLDGRPFGLVMCTVEENPDYDEQDVEGASVAAANHLVDVYGVPAVIGPSGSPATQAVFMALRDRGTLVFSPSASSPILTGLESDTPGLLWRAAPSDALEGAAIAEDMRGPGEGRPAVIDRVYVIHETGAYGEGLATVFYDAFTQLGGTITKLDPFSTDNELTDAISHAAVSEAEEVLFVAQTADVIRFTNTAAGLAGFADKRIFVTDTGAASDFVEQADPGIATRLRGSRPAPLDEATDYVYAQFVAAYRDAYGGQDVTSFSYTAHAYDSAWLVMYGAAWSIAHEGGLTGRGIGAGLRQVSSGDDINIAPVNWQPIVETFRNGESINIRGASGDLDYDPATEETTGPFQIWTIQGGQLVGVDTWEPPEE